MKEHILPWWFRKRDEEVRLPARPDYTVVSTINNKLIALLRRNMVPKAISGREEIGLCSPRDHGDMLLGVYLYDICENDTIRMSGMQPYDSGHVQFPPMYLELYYMITAYSNIDIRYREEENHRILTRTMQVLHDYPQMEGEDPIHVEYQNLTLDQKSAIWHNLGGEYRLSLFYKITPVKLESTIRKETVRVQEIQVNAFPTADEEKED